MTLIAIDNGHGKNTAGKRTPVFPSTNTFVHEWEFNYPTAKKLGQLLEYNGFRIIYTSDTEKDTPLKTRTDRANEANADLLISIHYNAFQSVWGTHGGIETYHYPSSNNGKKLAELVQEELIRETRLRNRGVKSANFQILRETKMPSILCECGFMDNLEEAQLMLDEEYQWKCARAMAKGICKYFNVEYKEYKVEVKKLYRVQVGAYSKKENAENMLKELEKAGFKGFISESDVEVKKEPDKITKPLSQYYEKYGLKVIETNPDNVYVSLLPGKTLREFGIYGINGTWQNTREAHLPRSVWGLAGNGNKAIGPNSHTNSPNDHKRGTIIYYEDGTLEIKRINHIKEITKPFKWCIGGGSLIPNIIDEEKFASDIYRFTHHTGIGYKGNRIYLIVTSTHCSMAEFRNRVLKLELDKAIFLDGGGSTQMNYVGGKGIHSSRKLSHGVFLKKA